MFVYLTYTRIFECVIYKQYVQNFTMHLFIQSTSLATKAYGDIFSQKLMKCYKHYYESYPHPFTLFLHYWLIISYKTKNIKCRCFSCFP